MSEAAPGQSTPRRRHTAAALLLIGLAAAAPILVSPGGRSAGAAIDRCAVPAEISGLGDKLPRTAAKLARGLPVTIVALGSSSTEGIGASHPDRSYPSRLEALLRAQFPGAAIRVVNRGVGGELAPQMAARLEREVLAEKPDLVIWQLGTNSVLRDIDPTVDGAVAESGIARIKAAGAEIMLMDLQYAPAVLLHAGYRDMLQMLSGIARSEDVPILHRFAMMRHWAEDGQMTLQTMLASDRLHMSDASYDCLARQVARSIVPPTSKQAAFLASDR
jgi:acyl-CoA thioesterase-1